MTQSCGFVDGTTASRAPSRIAAPALAQRIRELEHELATVATRLENAAVAIESRDVIGMAKGIVIATAGCTADKAFAILSAQSSAEGRKVYDLAAELVQRQQRRPRRADQSCQVGANVVQPTPRSE
jgi:AmiR/NasT family two-component response regulator